MRRSLFITIVLFGILFITNCQHSPNFLAENFRVQIKNERFEQIYDESSDFVHLNSTKDEFVKKLAKAVAKMKEADPELNWRDNFDIGDSSGIENTRIFIRKELGQKPDQVAVLIDYWIDKNGHPKFSGLDLIFYNMSESYSLPK